MAWKYVIETIGVIGAVEVLVAYALNLYKKIKADGLAFLLLNLTGGLLLIFYSLYKEAWASLAINAFWVIIACIHLAAYSRKKYEV